MKARKQHVVIATVALAAGVALCFWLGRSGDESAPSMATEPPAAGAPPATPVTAPTAATVDASATPEPRREVEQPAPANATLRGRCVDADGAPLAGCRVHLSAWESSSERLDKWRTDHGADPEWHEPPAVTTGADGRFAFTFWPPPPFQFALDVARDGCGEMSGRWGSLAEGGEVDVGDVAMTPGVRVTGRVVDGNGVPQDKEYVSLNRRGRVHIDEPMLEPRWGTTGVSKADGTFAVRGWLCPGDYDVRTQKLELQSPKAVTLRADHPAEELTIVVARPPASATITGRVLDETGAPATDVEINARSERGWTYATTKDDGTFALRRPSSSDDTTAELTVIAGVYDVEEREPRKVDWGATDVEFRVASAGVLTLRVTDPQQAPVEAYTVRNIPRNRGRFISLDSRVRAEGKHENGTAVVEGLSRGEWLLLVDFPASTGFGPLFVSFAHDGGSRRMDLRAEPTTARTVHVVGGDDAPVAGTKVQLCELFGKPLDDARFVMQQELWLMNSGNDNALVLCEGSTGSDGRVELRGPAGHDLGVCVLGPGHVPLRMSGVRCEIADELLVRVSRGARLTGRIVPPEALAELKRLGGGAGDGSFGSNRPHLAFTGDRGRVFPVDRLSSGSQAGLGIADDGTFEVDGIPPGRWRVQITAMMMTSASYMVGHNYPAGEVTLADGETTTRDLDLTYVLPGTLVGTVLLNGRPAANLWVSLSNEANMVNAQTDGDGRFRSELFAGDYTVGLRLVGANRNSSYVRCPTPAHVVRGTTTTATFVIASTRLEVTVRDAAGKPVAGAWLSVLGSNPAGIQLPPTDDAGVSTTDVASETVTLRVLPKELTTPEAQRQLWIAAKAGGDNDPLGSRWIALQTLALEAGQTSAFAVQLPASAGY